MINTKNYFWLKILLMLTMLATPVTHAQVNTSSDDRDTRKKEARAREFANFLIRNAEWDTYLNVRQRDLKRAVKIPYDTLVVQIPKLLRDSTKYAAALVNQAAIVNKIVPLDETPDHVYLMFDILYEHEKGGKNKNSESYAMGETILNFYKTIRELRLAQYAIKNKQK